MWLMPCLDLSSSTATKASVSEVESIFTMMSLLSLPTVTMLKALATEATSRTAAMTVVDGRATKTSRSPSNLEVSTVHLRRFGVGIMDQKILAVKACADSQGSSSNF